MTLYSLLKTVHVLAIVLWVGGMLFTHFFLRPAVQALEPPQRLRLMHDVLGRFFGAVLWAALLALASGLWMIGRVAAQAVQTAQAGGRFGMPISWTVMAGLGVLMIAIFGHLRFALYERLTRAVVACEWPAAAAAMAQIRRWVSVNLALGVIVIAVVLLV